MEEVLSRGRTTTAREPGALGLKDGRKDFREKDPKGLGGGGGGQGGWKWGEEVSPRDQSEKLVNFCPVLLLHLKFSDPSPPHCRHLWTTSSPGLAAHVTATVLD